MALLITFTCQFYYSIIFQLLSDTIADLSLGNERSSDDYDDRVFLWTLMVWDFHLWDEN